MGSGARLLGWNSSSAISCLCGLGQVTHPLCLSFLIYKKGTIALPHKVVGMIKKVNRCEGVYDRCEMCEGSAVSTIYVSPTVILARNKERLCVMPVIQGRDGAVAQITHVSPFLQWGFPVLPFCVLSSCVPDQRLGHVFSCIWENGSAVRTPGLRQGKHRGRARPMQSAPRLGLTCLPVPLVAGRSCLPTVPGT